MNACLSVCGHTVLVIPADALCDARLARAVGVHAPAAISQEDRPVGAFAGCLVTPPSSDWVVADLHNYASQNASENVLICRDPCSGPRPGFFEYRDVLPQLRGG